MPVHKCCIGAMQCKAHEPEAQVATNLDTVDVLTVI